MHRVSLPLIAFALLLLIGCAGDAGRYAPQTMQEARKAFRDRLFRETIESPLTGSLSDSTEAAWIGAFWGMVLSRHTSQVTDAAIALGLNSAFRRSPEFRRALLEVVYALYPMRFSGEIQGILLKTTEEKIFAMSALYMMRTRGFVRSGELSRTLHEHFPQWEKHPVLSMLDAELSAPSSQRFVNRPSLYDLLTYHMERGTPVLFSFHRHDRRYPGLTIVRDGRGYFVREQSGIIFHIPHLALAASNLPGYLTNGNTPQGMLSFQGLEHVTNQFIGPSVTIQLVLPFEVPPGTYFKDPRLENSTWTVELYDRLLPKSWREYVPVHEAFYAGKAGRNEIIAHGTTIDPEFYRGEPCSPNTPSLGCMTALETWSPTGEKVTSDQDRLVKVLRDLDCTRGYMYVIEIDDKAEPVEWGELEPLVLKADAAVESALK